MDQYPLVINPTVRVLILSPVHTITPVYCMYTALFNILPVYTVYVQHCAICTIQHCTTYYPYIQYSYGMMLFPTTYLNINTEMFTYLLVLSFQFSDRFGKHN